MNSIRLAVLIFVLLFVLWSRVPSLSLKSGLHGTLSEERQSLDILNFSTYGGLDVANDRWLNLTGLRHEDGYAWDILPRVQKRARELLEYSLKSLEVPRKIHDDSQEPGTPNFTNGGSRGERALSSMRLFEDAPSFYQNLTSIVSGSWVRSHLEENIVRPTVNLSAVAPNVYYTSKEYDQNITGSTGDLRIEIHDEVDMTQVSNLSTVRSVKAVTTIQDETSDADGWVLDLYGVHFPELGSVLLSTTSAKFAGIFALPHFAPSGRAFALVQELLNQRLMESIKRQEMDVDNDSNPWMSSGSSEAVYPTPHCEFIVYLQQHPVHDVSIELTALEQELRFPTGAAISSVPLVKMSALIFSPDCGFILESKGPPLFAPQEGERLIGKKLEQFTNIARRCILAFAAFICAQTFLWSSQVIDSATPSTKSRISFHTIGLLAMGDGLTFFTAIVLAITPLFRTTFLPLIAIAFLSYLCIVYLETDFLMEIWAVQAPERREREREQGTLAAPTVLVPAGTTRTVSPDAPVDAESVDSLPLPVTARRPANAASVPISIPPDQDLDNTTTANNPTQAAPPMTIGNADLDKLNFLAKFYLLGFAIWCISLLICSKSRIIRNLYTNAAIFLYFSVWTPQIKRNVLRNCRQALRWEFVIGQSILRLIPILYFYTVPNNILYVYNDVNAAYVYVAWTWLQICALISQAVLGPRFFVPNGWAPPAYDYHPILREGDEEAGVPMPIGFTQATIDPALPTAPSSGGSSENSKKIFDCAICTEIIELPIVSSSHNDGDRGTATATLNLFSRRAYMVTPCRHIFHTQCLEGWMRYRLQCPICREDLPAL